MARHRGGATACATTETAPWLAVSGCFLGRAGRVPAHEEACYAPNPVMPAVRPVDRALRQRRQRPDRPCRDGARDLRPTRHELCTNPAGAFLGKAHDPTQLNRQGPDTGTQYRSALFPVNGEQARIAKDYIAQLNRARVFPAAIVTKIEPGMSFYPAEEYSPVIFLTLNPTYPYIVINDLPKVEGLKRFFPADYRAEPVLVLGKAAKKK